MITIRKPTEQEIKEAQTWDIWTKEPSVFFYTYNEKEVCYIIEGEASVTYNDGKVVKFGQGDWAIFEKGLKCTWKITKTIRKHYYLG